ncbi:type II inositol-1,4,5-trisphosphate 5-phosphatase [Coniella lustricola]|uniref:Type II inositol-1,4,5-trisphosphate 5-phosphatase n=1 Tax=Coniella lustricola TaxID=2025994 RepID=A0A2T3A4F1_9PEZI|nr:type II inositol-1,4,5-trisphosphate 5-phosphatase [Coniella lustricola]
MDARSETHTQPASDGTEPVDLGSVNPHSLHSNLYARRAEYTRVHRIRVKVSTWNVAACPGTDKDLAAWFVDEGDEDAGSEAQTPHPTSQEASDMPRAVGGDRIGLYVLGLQEVVNLNPVSQYVYSDSKPTDKWRAALEAAMPKGCTFVAAEQMSGLLLLVYAASEVAPLVGNISTKAVGTGVGGWFGNKGAAIVRIVLGEATKMVFVNSHLSSGSDPSTIERRCWDVRTIFDRARFDAISVPGDDRIEDQDKLGDEDFAFWFGDLNFRLHGIPGDDIRRILTLHTKGEYVPTKPDGEDREEITIAARAHDSSDEEEQKEDSASSKTQPSNLGNDDDSVVLPDPDDFDPDPHEDPASLQATLDSLLPHDQLQQVIKQQRVFHDGWREGPITFLPTYKYDVGTVAVFDSSEKKRAPSWCDRILYRTKLDREQHETKHKEETEARKRDEEMKARGIDHAGDDDEVLFDYDPENDGDVEPVGKPGLDYDEYDETGSAAGHSASHEERHTQGLTLDTYTSHQWVTSSDHKPVSATFVVDFDAVVPELKVDVYAEVARDIDRAENEGRPTVTIVSEASQSGPELVEFEDMRFLERRTASLTVANTGRVPATISFVANAPEYDAEDDSPSHQWLLTSLTRPEPTGATEEPLSLEKEVMLEPGETVNAVVEAFIGQLSHARLLNDGRGTLDEVLILRVADGRDHFIRVRAAWLPTCMGRSIDELIRVPDGGIRAFAASLANDKKVKFNGAIPYDLEIHRSAPKELFKLIEALEILTDRTVADEQMLASYTIPRDKHGWPFENCVAGSHEDLVPAVVEALDTDRPIADGFPAETNPCQRLETVAEVLLLFLRGLTDGVVNIQLWSIMEQAPVRAFGQTGGGVTSPTGSPAEAEEDDRTAILDVLTNAPNHNICFVFLTTTLAKIITELAPVQKNELEVLKMTTPGSPTSGGSAIGGAIGAIGRRSLVLRRSLTGRAGSIGGMPSISDALIAVERRRSKEKRVAQLFGSAICRTPPPLREKERRALDGKQATLVELFLRRRDANL